MVLTGFSQAPFFPDVYFCLEAPLCDIPAIVFQSRSKQVSAVVEEALSVTTPWEAECRFG